MDIKPTPIFDEFVTFCEATFNAHPDRLPPLQRVQLEAAFFGGAIVFAGSVMDDNATEQEAMLKLDTVMKEIEAFHSTIVERMMTAQQQQAEQANV